MNENKNLFMEAIKDIHRNCLKQVNPIINKEDWNTLRDKLGVLPLGLLATELQILRILAERKEVRLTALAAITGLSRGSIQKDYEMYLTKMGLMEINAGGRAPTAKGLKYLKQLDEKSVRTAKSKKTKRKT